MDIDEILEQSICKDCEFQVTRVISSVGMEFVNEKGEEVELDDCDVVHTVCSLLSVDLDCLVKDCTGYKPKDLASKFFKNPTIRGALKK